MQVIVILLDSWRSSAEAAALALLHLSWSPQARVLLVGQGDVPSDLAAACDGRTMERVTAPLHAMPGRRLPDTRTSGDSPQLGWSLAVMERLLGLHAQQRLCWVELPSLGALAYALLQERDLLDAFDGTRLLLRFDGLTAIQAMRLARGVSPADLLTMDMERACLEHCDGVLMDSAAMAAAVAGVLSTGDQPVRWQVARPLSLQAQSAAVAGPQGLVCVATETGPLRQALRAICGYLGTVPDAPAMVTLVCEQGVLQEVLAVVPETLRHRFVIRAPSVLQGPPTRVILADCWSAGAARARALLARGHALLANAANPAYDPAQGWEHGQTLLRYDGAAELCAILQTSADWRPRYRLDVLPGTEALPRVVGSVGPATVSVIVPCFNMGRWLPQTLASIKRFSWQWLDVIVVDDGSTDAHTRQVLAQLESEPAGKVRVVRLPFNQGLSAARNAGLAAAQGEFILSLDADDLVSPEFVQLAVQALQRCSGYDFVVPRAVYFADQDTAVDLEALPLLQCIAFVGSAFESGVLANRFSTATCLARTRVLRTLGYDENLRSYEDWQLYRRALQQGSRFLVSNDIHFYYRQRPDSMIHDPAMRARHSRLYAEMTSMPALQGQPLAVPANLLSVIVAPAAPDGSAGGILLSGVIEVLEELAHFRRSRFWQIAHRLWIFLRKFRR